MANKEQKIDPRLLDELLKEADSIGRRSLFRSGDQRDNRRQFVGFEPVRDTAASTSGAHFIHDSNGTWRSKGVITSARFSPILDSHIGMGLLEGGVKRKGEEIIIFDDSKMNRVRIVDSVFYDPNGENMHG